MKARLDPTRRMVVMAASSSRGPSAEPFDGVAVGQDDQVERDGRPGGRGPLHHDLGRRARAIDVGAQRLHGRDRLDVEAPQLAGQPGVGLGLQRRPDRIGVAAGKGRDELLDDDRRRRAPSTAGSTIGAAAAA